jgi:hypothetical protein
MLNLRMNLDFVESIARCVRLDAISLDVLRGDTKSEHEECQILSLVSYLANSFAELALSALSALRESATFSRFDAIVRDPSGVHQLNFSLGIFD